MGLQVGDDDAMNKGKRKLYAVSHSGHWPVGGVSVVMALNEAQAKARVFCAIVEDGIAERDDDPEDYISLVSRLDFEDRDVYILANGNY